MPPNCNQSPDVEHKAACFTHGVTTKSAGVRHLMISAGWLAAASGALFAYQIYYGDADDILDGRSLGFAPLVPACILLVEAGLRAWRDRHGRSPMEP